MPDFPNNLAPDSYFEPTLIDGGWRCCGRRRGCPCGNYRFNGALKHPERNLAKCPLCGDDRRCMFKTGTLPNHRCRHHGGKVTRGVDSPTFTHGKNSMITQAVPAIYRERFLAFRADPDLLDNSNQIAMLATRWLEQTESLESGGSAAGIKELQELWGELESINKQVAAARESGDADLQAKLQKEFTAKLSAIGKAIKSSGDKIKAWEDWKDTTRDLSALRIDQAKMKDFQARYMESSVAIAYGIALRDAVMEVLDVRTHGRELLAIVQKLDKVMGNGVVMGRVTPTETTVEPGEP
jgi:hypothetical protein